MTRGLRLISFFVGIMFAYQGFQKACNGRAGFVATGAKMKNVGVKLAPMLALAVGLAIAATEVLGGMALVAGKGEKLASIGLLVVVAYSLLHHFRARADWKTLSFPLLLGVILMGILVD